MNILPTLFGTGIGSESVINVNMSDAPDAVLNPHSQVVRLFYSSGIIGSVIYVMAFYLPVYKISKIYKSKVFIYLTLLILGASLGHRSVVIFIFLGAFLAIFKQLSNNQKTWGLLFPPIGLRRALFGECIVIWRFKVSLYFFYIFLWFRYHFKG